MEDSLLDELKEQFATEIGDEKYLTGKPREYYCDEHGTIVAAIVYDPYDAPSYICPDCHKKLSMHELE